MLESQRYYWFGKELKVYDHEALTVAAAVVQCTAAKLAVAGNEKAVRAWITVEGADIRYRLDGVVPTAATGHRLNDGMPLEVEGWTNLERLRFIAVAGTATVRCSYARYA